MWFWWPHNGYVSELREVYFSFIGGIEEGQVFRPFIHNFKADQINQNDFVELSNTPVFPASDSVKNFAYDPNHQRIIITSHFGQVKMYNFNGGELTEWETHRTLNIWKRKPYWFMVQRDEGSDSSRGFLFWSGWSSHDLRTGNRNSVWLALFLLIFWYWSLP